MSHTIQFVSVETSLQHTSIALLLERLDIFGWADTGEWIPDALWLLRPVRIVRD